MAIEKRQLKLMEEVAVLTTQRCFAGGAQISSFGDKVPCGFHRSPKPQRSALLLRDRVRGLTHDTQCVQPKAQALSLQHCSFKQYFWPQAWYVKLYL